MQAADLTIVPSYDTCHWATVVRGSLVIAVILVKPLNPGSIYLHVSETRSEGRSPLLHRDVMQTRDEPNLSCPLVASD